MEIDPIRYEMFLHRLWAIGEEGRMTLQRVTASPIVSQGGECMSSFYNAQGTMVLACSGHLRFAAATSDAIKVLIDWFGQSPGFYDGDQIFFNDPYVDPSELYGGDSSFYSAQAVQRQIKRPGGTTTSTQWYANFFPDLTVWDRLTAYTKAGRLAYSGGVRFPKSAIRTGLMVLPSRRYRTAHRHGPGVTIVGVQEAQGFVIMWPEGGDYVVAPWQEGSVFVPPNQWYHMHVNSGAVENRQLRIFPPQPLMNYTAPDPKKYIPFVEEDPWIRKKFEEELAKNGLTSLMPDGAYTDPDFVWDEDWLKED